MKAAFQDGHLGIMYLMQKKKKGAHEVGQGD